VIKRFVEGMKDPDRRKYFITFLGGKMAGVGLALAAVWVVSGFLHTPAGAQEASEAPPITDVVNATNTAWTLVAAFLVFFMQAGFMMLEAGFARTREAGNVLMECIVDTAMCAILFWAIGFAFMFGVGNSWIGHEFFFLNGAPATYGTTGVAFMAFFLFQFAFADTASTITSGAMVGRTGFVGDLLYSVGVSGFVYPILGHWVWGPGGWLATMDTPFRDFAGSTVVHTVGGGLALCGALMLGPRLGRVFKRDGGGLPPGHDLTIAAIGGVILWFGWYGFNPGSTLSALDAAGIGRVATNTTLAAAAGGLSAMFFVYPRLRKWDIGITINGFLGGLVAVTAPCYWINGTGAIIIGAIAGVVVVLAVDLLENLRIDDPIGAVPVHFCCGIWGTLAVGLFATGQFGVPGAGGADTTSVVEGLFWGGGTDQLVAQLKGSASMTLATIVLGLLLMGAVRMTKTLRISEEGELQGIDIHEHGAPIYHPEAAFIGVAPSGVAPTGAVAAGGSISLSETATTSR
jgi:ammonium transporter, Amt family